MADMNELIPGSMLGLMVLVLCAQSGHVVADTYSWPGKPGPAKPGYLRLFGKSRLTSWYLPALQNALQNVPWEAKLIMTCRLGKR